MDVDAFVVANRPTWDRLEKLVKKRRKLSGAEVDQRLMGTAASVTAAILAGARVVRIHDVGELRQTVQLAEAIRNAS